jgi:hypothetical protein
MSKHASKLISVLLAIGMLVSSLGIVASADETAESTNPPTEATATPTASPEATPTATPEATATPTPSVDTYYEEALNLVGALKIFEGYGDGDIKPEATITRAEMAKVILTTLNMTSLNTYQGGFSDVAADHWAANIIQTAGDYGIINGMGDGTFGPDNPVKYEQAVKMVICALRYGQEAEMKGGYPEGYLVTAAKKDIEVTKGISGYTVGQDAPRGVVVKMIYNALNALYPVQSGITAQGPQYQTKDGVTLASEVHNVYKEEGIVTATYKTALDSSKKLGENQVMIEGVVYEKDAALDMEQHLAKYVKVYYREYNDDGIKQIVSVIPMDNKYDEVTLDAEKIDEIVDARSANGYINYRQSTNSVKKYKLKAPSVIYNGQKLLDSDYEVAKEDGQSYEDFITPEVGTIKLTDYNDDGYYDVVDVKKYETILVASASEKTIINQYKGVKPLNVNNEDDDKIVTVTKGGSAIKPRNLAKWDVATVLRSVNQTGDKQLIDIEVCNDTISGKIQEKYEEDEDTYVKVDGKEYKVDSHIVEDVKAGNEYTIYLDKFGRVAGVDSASGSKLSGGEKYAWIMNIYSSREKDNPIIRLYTQDGKMEEYEVASKLDYWGPKDTSSSSLYMDKTADRDKVLHPSYITGMTEIRFAKYKVNSEDKINKLYIAVSKDSVSNEDAVIVDTKNFRNATMQGGMLNSTYYITDGITQFVVPNNTQDMNDLDAYEVRNSKAGDYTAKEGLNIDLYLGEIKDNKPGISIRFVNSSSSSVSSTDYGTADDNPTMMVSKITKGIDADTDDEVYYITGYSGGNKVTYKTSTKTSVLELANTGSVFSDKNYNTTEVWSATKSKTELTDYLRAGDICGVSADGATAKILIKMVDSKAYVDGSNQFSISRTSPSNTRDAITFGQVTDMEISDSIIVSLETGNKLTLATDKAITVFDVRKGKVEEDSIQPAELETYIDDNGDVSGDVMFVREFAGGMREVYVIRF